MRSRPVLSKPNPKHKLALQVSTNLCRTPCGKGRRHLREHMTKGMGCTVQIRFGSCSVKGWTTGSTARRTMSQDCRYKIRFHSAQPARLRRCRSFQRRGTFYPGGGRGRPGRRIWCRWHRIPRRQRSVCAHWDMGRRFLPCACRTLQSWGKLQQNIPHLPRKRLVRAARGKRCGHVRDIADLSQRGKDQCARI